MKRKAIEKARAVKLRKKGLSYLEIREYLPVAKSTLSLWLRDIPLTKKQIRRLRIKGGRFQHLASQANKRKRIERTQRILTQARSEIGAIDKNALQIIGTVLYWAEGSKQKPYDPSIGTIFSNSDPLMVRVYLKWLREIVNIKTGELDIEIYIHKSYGKNRKALTAYWSKVTGFPPSLFGKIRYKRNKVRSYRKNRGKNYWGVLRVSVRKSVDLNRRITGWIEGICFQCGVV